MPAGRHAGFRVREKTFAWHTDDHHGDGMVAVTFKAGPGVQAALVGAEPAKFFVPPYLGPRGWIGLRLDRDEVDWDEVADLVTDSYRLIAPRRLVAQLDRG